jgi:hypothetical protein
MADLHEACEAAGLDSSKYRPIAHATDSARVAVYIGASYAHLTRGQALNLRDQLTRALQQLDGHSLQVQPDQSPAPFGEQLAEFHRQVTRGYVRGASPALREALALAEISKEPQS